MRICAVTQRVDRIPQRGEVRDGLDQRLASWVWKQGFLPVPVPNCLGNGNGLRVWLRDVDPACVVLSGGNDWGEFPRRDRTEFGLLEWCRRRKIRVFGICRGMQVMALFAGGKLKKAPGHCGRPHGLAGSRAVVNSFHRWAVPESPPGFRVIHRARDGIIEQIRHEKLPWEAVMWHPERPGNAACGIRLCGD